MSDEPVSCEDLKFEIFWTLPPELLRILKNGKFDADLDRGSETQTRAE